MRIEGLLKKYLQNKADELGVNSFTILKEEIISECKLSKKQLAQIHEAMNWLNKKGFFLNYYTEGTGEFFTITLS